LTTTEVAPLLQRSNAPTLQRSNAPTLQRSNALPSVVANNLLFAYPDGPQVLNGLSLEVSEGQFVALAGPNGGGKTTFAKHLNGLLRPAAGSLCLFGEETAGRRVGELARQVGYVFQNPDLQLFAPTVREELAFGPRNLGLDDSEIAARIEAALEHFDLHRWAEVPPAVLGYGLRRLVTLAAVWAMRPRLWVLDEPTTGLDAHLTARLVEAMQRLHREGHTLLLITHDLRLVASLAERLVIIAEGKVALDGTPRTLLPDADALRSFGLRPPPIPRLARKVPALPNDLLTVEELLSAFQ
jgi:energy-coupling factor transporter ATP-binding protein EcfA2